MFKIVFIFIAGLCIFTANASAESLYSYTCESVGSESIFNDTLQLEIFEDNFVAVTIEALPYYADGDASPVTIKKKELMSVRLKSSKDSVEYQLDTEPFLMETALFNGGYPLKKGGKGGFVKFVGQAFSYANFICVLN